MNMDLYVWSFPTVLWFVSENKQHLFENQRWMPYFHDNKNLSQWDKLTRPKKNLKPPNNKQTQTVNSLLVVSLFNWKHRWYFMFTCVIFHSFDVFRFKGGWVGIPPFLRGQCYPPYFHYVHPPTLRGGYINGCSGSMQPESLTLRR